MKFCVKKQNHVQTQVTWPKYKILKIQDGGRPPFWKWFYRYNLSWESSNFSEIWCADSNFGSMNGHVLIYKKIMKFKMANSRHVENHLLAISPRVIVRLTRYLICTSRTMLRHTPRDENSNFWKFKIADGRYFEMVSSLYLSRGSSEFNEIWCATADFGSKDSHVTKYQNFANSKWRTAALLVSNYMSAYRSGDCSELIGDVLLCFLQG